MMRTLHTHVARMYFRRSDAVLTVSPGPTTITTIEMIFKSMQDRPVEVA